MSKSYQLTRTEKNFPSLSPLTAATAPGLPLQPKPSMSTKPKADVNLLGPSSPCALPSVLLASSSSSNSLAIPATWSHAAVASSQSPQVINGLAQATGLIAEIDEFISNPSTKKLSETSQSIKNCLENLDFKQFAACQDYKSHATTLATQIIRFWSEAATSIQVPSENQQFTRVDIAKISYGLQACITWDKDNLVFQKSDWQELRPAICQLMRKLINGIDEHKLAVVKNKRDVGNLLALLSWIGVGVRYQVPDFGLPASPKDGSQYIPLLFGFTKKNGTPSLREITVNLIECLLNAPAAQFDTRQVCKMAMRLGRMISAGLLATSESSEKPWIDPTKLGNALEKLFLSNLFNEYTEAGHNNGPGYVNPIAVDNLCESLLIFFSIGVLSWGSRNHQLIARRAANFIKQAATAPKADSNFTKTSAAFLQEAIKNEPSEFRQPFNDAKKEVNS